MPPQTTNAKIDELRFRLKSDPKSRLFFPLAEELRKIDQLSEAEQVLRIGLAHHPTYLSAWVSLGRVLHEAGKQPEAVEALSKAIQLDPGNVVAARLLGDAYLALGDKVEAIKKYKLVRALLPVDEELDATIEALDRELNPAAPVQLTPETESAAAGEAATVLPFAPPDTLSEPAAPAMEPLSETSPFGRTPDFGPAADSPWAEGESVFDRSGDHEPMRAAHAESPFEEPVSAAGDSADGMAVEPLSGMHIEEAPLSSGMPAPLPGGISPFDEPVPLAAAALPPLEAAGDVADVFAPEEPTPAQKPASADDVTATLTMAELYEKQGLVAEARRIYEEILSRDPGNGDVRRKLEALGANTVRPSPPPASAGGHKAKLERWLTKVKREAGDV